MLILLALSLTMAMAVFALGGAEKEKERVVSDQVICVFDKETSNKKIDSILEKSDAEREAGVKTGGEKIVLAEAGDENSASGTIAELKDVKKVKYVQPNYLYKISDQDTYTVPGNRIYQYSLDLLNVKKAWQIVSGSKKQTTKVAVLDTGVDAMHEDLQATVKSTKDAYTGKILDTAEDAEGHGTHVAGIIGATYGNGKGVAGLASGENNDLCQIMSYNTLDDEGYMSTFSLITSVADAVKQGAKVVNMSLGGYSRDRILTGMIRKAHYEDGVTFIAAAGNESSDDYSEPSDIKEVISVCNCNDKRYMALSSNFGLAKDITAPGERIVSTVPNNGYKIYSGTSMAAPAVSAVSALILDVNPKLDPAQVRNIICGSADPGIGSGAPSYYREKSIGYGMLNAARAVEEAKKPVTDKVDSIEIKTEEGEDTIDVFMDDVSKNNIPAEYKKYLMEGTALETLIRPLNSSAKIKWSSEDETIASVDEKGYVKGKKPGKTTKITAEAGGKETSVNVRILKSSNIKKIWIDLSDRDKVIYEGEQSLRLINNLQSEPRYMDIPEYYWTSSDPQVISVNNEGVIDAKKPGKAVITVSAPNGISDSCELTVKSVPDSIRISCESNWLRVGQGEKVRGHVFDKRGNEINDVQIVFGSGNKSIASVSRDGKVKAKKAGGIYVVAKVKWPAEKNGEIAAYKKIIITKKNYKGKDYKLKKAGNRKLKWRKIPKVSAYQIARASSVKKNTKNKFRIIGKTKGNKNTFTDKKAKKGRTYCYKIRGLYVKDGKKRKYGYSGVVKMKAGKKPAKKAKDKTEKKVGSELIGMPVKGKTIMPALNTGLHKPDIKGSGARAKIKKGTFRGQRAMIAPIENTDTTEYLETIKNNVRDIVDMELSDVVYDKSFYCKEVWNEIDSSINRIYKIVDDAKRVSDILIIDYIFAEMNDVLSDELIKVQCMGKMIKHYVRSSADIKKMASIEIKRIKTMKKEADKKYFNDYYWGILQNFFRDNIRKLRKVSTAGEYAQARMDVEGVSESISEVIEYGQYEEDGETEEEPENNDESQLIANNDDVNGGDVIISQDMEMGIVLYEEIEQYVFTKAQVQKERDLQKILLEAYIDYTLKQSGYKGNIKALKKDVKKFTDNKLKKIESVDEIHKAGKNKLADLVRKTGVTCEEMTSAEYAKAAEEYNTITSDYSKFNYSAVNWDKVETAFADAKFGIEVSEYAFEAHKIIEILKNELGKIPEVKGQFNTEKKKIKKDFNACAKNKKKYNRKKIGKVVKKAINRINKVPKYDMTELHKVRNAYKKKISKCVNKFKISVSSNGRGMVISDKDGKVKYGKDCKVKFSPDAGYRIKKIFIDGKRLKHLVKSYTFKKVKKNHKVKVAFGK